MASKPKQKEQPEKGEEIRYYQRIIVMLMDLATDTLLKLFKSLIPQGDVSLFLDSMFNEIEELKKSKKLSAAEYNRISKRPLVGTELDIAILIKLMLELLPKKLQQVSSELLPFAADLKRLRGIRNELIGHRPAATITKKEFDYYWEMISIILKRILPKDQSMEELDKRMENCKTGTVSDADVQKILEMFANPSGLITQLKTTNIMAHQRHLEKTKYRQWVKAGLGLTYLREGIAPFCDDIAKQQHKDILDNIKQTKNLSTLACGQCDWTTLRPDHAKGGNRSCMLGQRICNCCNPAGKNTCQNKVCGAIYDAIVKSHGFTPPAPYWKNTETQHWCTDPWSIAKCFINAPGYEMKTSADDIDCIGLLRLIRNNQYFHNHIQCTIAQTDIFSKVIADRNEMFHSSTMELEETEANNYIDDMIAVLQDGKELINRQDAKYAVKKLEELKNKDFIITTENEAKLLGDVAEEIRNMLERFENETEDLATKEECDRLKKQLSELKEEMNRLKADVSFKQETFDYEQSKLANMIPAEIMRMDKDSIDLYKQLLNEGEEAVHNIRVMVVGPFGVGKTTLTKRLFMEDVDLNLQESTNGIDVHARRCKVSLSNGHWNILEKGKKSDNTATRLAKLLNKRVNEQKTIEKNETKRPNWAVSTNSDSVEAEVLYERKRMREEQEETLVENAVPIVSPIEERSDSEVSLTVVSTDQAIQTVGSKDQAIQNEFEDLMIEVQTLDATDQNSADLSVWDFAGQYVFYSTHRVFLSERAIYLLVTDISKDVNEIVKDDSCAVDCNNKKQWTVSEFVHFWLNSIHEFCSFQDDKGPPVLLVGTFTDQLDQKTKGKIVEKYFRELRASVCGKGTFCHIEGNEDFDVDNSVMDNKIERLRKTIFDIASKQSYWGEHIPAKWITLERKIVSEKDLGKKVLYKKQLRDLNGELPISIDTDEELELFLRFHHESGNILYFRDAQLSDSIVLDPQWLIDAFKRIITEKTFYKRKETILQNWLEFEKSAKLTDTFVDMVWEKSEFHEHKDLLLRYLQKLGFIVKPRQQSNSAKATDYYFVPCILKTPPKEELLASVNCGHQKSTSKLCFKTASGFLPTAVFNQLLAACISKWSLSESNNEYMLYCGFGVFDIEECHTLFVSFYDHEIQLWITNDQEPENDICANIYTFVHSFLQNDCGLSRDFKTFLRCPAASVRSNERRFSIDEVAKEKKVKCKCTSPNHVLLTENLTRYWFIESADSIYENDRELSEQDLTTIACFIGRNWQILGSKLGLTEVEIQHIEDDNRNSTVKQILTMLHKWRREVSSEAKSVCNLYKAMKSCNDVVKFEWKSIKSVFNGK